jgi:hypothetical protein
MFPVTIPSPNATAHVSLPACAAAQLALTAHGVICRIPTPLLLVSASPACRRGVPGVFADRPALVYTENSKS